MDKSYIKFKRLGISLSPIGIEQSEECVPYFCTPKGASIIGWAGTDGIHYCRIRGFGNMIFAVNPMNATNDYVHPIAEDFETLLRLILACGDAAGVEQAWLLDKEQFDAYLKQNVPTSIQNSVITEISSRFELSELPEAWQYLHDLQQNFDHSKIKYTEDYYDPEMNPNAVSTPYEWKVYYDGSFWGHQGRARAGTEIPVDRHFDWSGHHWIIPSVYSCSKGIVVDFCMRVDAEEIRAFMKKWNLSRENDSCENYTHDQQIKIELDNPLNLNIQPKLELNGRKMQNFSGCSVSYNPCLPNEMINESEAKLAVDHYGLDATYGWVISRNAFPWSTRGRPEINSLFLTMKQQPELIPGSHFKVHAPGDSFVFSHPVSMQEYILTVQDLEQQALPENSFDTDHWIYPTHFTFMSYTLSPETTEKIIISDCNEGDKPIENVQTEDPITPAASSNVSCIGIIGGADGPTAIAFGGNKQGNLRTACSALHFEPVQSDIEWQISFHEKRFDNFTISLI
ncbi:MAG: hypothetical protein Q4F95_09495 [Oscillospiraceae bacterium]|nr:hypothetical protein [Oscillospiraceae bacterium]